MSIEAVSLVLACFPHPGMKMLAVSLADAASPEGERIFKSIATLATHSGQSERTVQRMLPRLVAEGWLIADGESSGGRGRTNAYRIDPNWMALAHHEQGFAKAERRQPRRVPFRSGELDLQQKGDTVSPFTETKRVTNRPLKGDKFELKGDKNALKGDTHVSPEHRTLNNITNTPLPPTGGDRVDNFEIQTDDQTSQATQTQSHDAPKAAEPAKPSAEALAELLAELIAEHPNHETADTANAKRALAQCAANALDPAGAERLGGRDHEAQWRGMREALLAALRTDAKSPRWQGDGHRFVPRLSKWLRGHATLQSLPEQATAPRPAPKTEAEKSSEMLAKMAVESAKCRPPPPEIAARIAQLKGRRRVAVAA